MEEPVELDDSACLVPKLSSRVSCSLVQVKMRTFPQHLEFCTPRLLSGGPLESVPMDLSSIASCCRVRTSITAVWLPVLASSAFLNKIAAKDLFTCVIQYYWGCAN